MGTHIDGLHQGTLDYIESKGLGGDYSVDLVEDPTWEWVVDEVTRSQDVVLLLGFGTGTWAAMPGAAKEATM